MYSIDTYSKKQISYLEMFLRSSFPGLTEANIKFLKTKTVELSNIYNAIFKNICLYYNNRNDDFILMKIKDDIKEKQKEYLKDFCIGNYPMHLPPIRIPNRSIICIPKIIFKVINSVKRSQSNLMEDILQIIPDNLLDHEAQFLMGIIYGIIKIVLFYEGNLHNINYKLLDGHKVYSYITQTVSIAQQIQFINLIDESKFNAEIMRVIDNFNGEIDIVIVKMIIIGIVIGFMSVKKSYTLKIANDMATEIQEINDLTENLIKELLPKESVQTGNCIQPIFSDENLKDLFNKIKETKKTKLAIMCKNFNSKNTFDMLRLLEDKQSGEEYGNCIEWSRDRKLFREALIKMIMTSNFFDIMQNSVSLLPANLLEQDKYIKFNQTLEDYKIRRQNIISHDFN
jgi:hypothetical protein